MARMISKRGFARYPENPFLENHGVELGARKRKVPGTEKYMVVDPGTGEVAATAGFYEVHEVDETKFVKLFIQGAKAFSDLSNPGTKVLAALFEVVQKHPGVDAIYLPFLEVAEATSPPLSRATFNRGMTELIEKAWLAETPIPNKYWINVSYLFNGDKLRFVKEYRKKQNTGTPSLEQTEEENKGE